MGISDSASIIFFLGGGRTKEGQENFRGQKCKKENAHKAHKNCNFYAEIVKFGLILTHLKLFWGQENIFFWGGDKCPYAPCAWHRHDGHFPQMPWEWG